MPEPVKSDTVAFVGVTSAAVNPVTASPNVAVTTIAPFTGLAAAESVSVGPTLSNVRASRFDAALPLPAPSCPASAGTLTVTAPWPAGVTSNVYDAPAPTKLATVPLATMTSPAVKPVTASLKVTANGIGDTRVGCGAVVASVAVGPTLSNVRVKAFDGPLGLPAVSWAAPAATLAPKLPCAAGVRVNVYVVPEPLKFETVAFVGVMSAAVNPVTASPNVAVTTMAPLTAAGAADDSVSAGPALTNVRVSEFEARLSLPAASEAAPAATLAPKGPSAVGVRVNV